MQGLRSNEGEDFEKFLGIVEEEAKKLGGIFFCDTFEGRDISLNDMKDKKIRLKSSLYKGLRFIKGVVSCQTPEKLWEDDKWYDMYIFVNYSLDADNNLALNFDKK